MNRNSRKLKVRSKDLYGAPSGRVWPENPTHALRRPLRVSGGCATRRYVVGRIQLGFGVTIGLFICGLSPAASGVEGAFACLLLYGTGWRTRTTVTIRGALAQHLIAQTAAR